MSAEPLRLHTPADQVPAAAVSPSSALLLDIRALSVLLARSVAALERDEAAGRLPAPVRLGRSKRWRREEVEAWVSAGCPDRKTWESMRTADGPRGSLLFRNRS